MFWIAVIMAIGIFYQDMDHALKHHNFESLIYINILVKIADGQSRLGTVENIVTVNEHIRGKSKKWGENSHLE